jgi:hypothetical protein
MSKITVTTVGSAEMRKFDRPGTLTTHYLFEGPDGSIEVSDSYHTMNELYDHRITVFIALCQSVVRRNELVGEPVIPVWRSKFHSDGSNYDGWFVMGIFKTPGNQITYHLPITKWDETAFAETLDNAPEWDGHQPADVLERLKKLKDIL